MALSPPPLPVDIHGNAACSVCSCLWPLDTPLLQALALPELGEPEREALAALTALTRLAFTAAGKGAVGPSLLALTRLQSLAISLAHEREHFIVLHPRVDWGALRTLRCLRQLSLCHLAAYAFFPAPEVTWSDEAPVAVEAEQLLAELPGIQTVQLRWARGGGRVQLNSCAETCVHEGRREGNGAWYARIGGMQLGRMQNCWPVGC